MEPKTCSWWQTQDRQCPRTAVVEYVDGSGRGRASLPSCRIHDTASRRAVAADDGWQIVELEVAA